MSGLKLIPPRANKTKNWYIRGTYLKQSINRSTGTTDKKVATKLLKKLKEDIEQGIIEERMGRSNTTFSSAALGYVQAGKEKRFLLRLVDYFGDRSLADIGQLEVDKAATTLYPNATPATRNRQVYTPVSAVFKHAKFERSFNRPEGSEGEQRTAWLSVDEARDIIISANEIHPRFGALCTFLLYTGCRLSEALRLRPENLDLKNKQAFIKKTKNKKPRTVHLTFDVLSALADNKKFGKTTVFGFSKGGRLYDLLDEAASRAGVRIPDRVAFHIFRHTYGAWMRRFAGADTSALVATEAWASPRAAKIYEHVDASDASRLSNKLPRIEMQENGGKSVERKNR